MSEGEVDFLFIISLFFINFLNHVFCSVFVFCNDKLKGGIFSRVRIFDFGRIVPRRYAVTPPQLSADAPILNVLQPVFISVLIFLGIELDIVVHDGWQSDVCKVLHFQEPLQRETRLDCRVGVSLGISYFIDIVLHLFQQSRVLQVFGNLFPAVKAVHAYIQRAGI